MAAKKTEPKTEVVNKPVEEPKKVEVKSKWVAGKYKVLRTYCGSLGVFYAGNVYELTKEQAEAFGKAGEILCL